MNEYGRYTRMGFFYRLINKVRESLVFRKCESHEILFFFSLSHSTERKIRFLPTPISACLPLCRALLFFSFWQWWIGWSTWHSLNCFHFITANSLLTTWWRVFAECSSFAGFKVVLLRCIDATKQGNEITLASKFPDLIKGEHNTKRHCFAQKLVKWNST